MSKKIFNSTLRLLLWVNALAWITLLISYILYTESEYKKILEFHIYFTILFIHSCVFTIVAIMSRNSSSKFFMSVAIYFAFTTYIFYEMVAQDFFNECLEIGDLDVKICVLSKVFFGVHSVAVLIYVIVFFTTIRTKSQENSFAASPDVELAPLHKVTANQPEILQHVVPAAVLNDERCL